MNRLLKLLPALGPVLLLGLTALGCNDSSRGSVALPGQQANFEVTNKYVKSIDVFVDGDEIGRVQPGATVPFVVVPGRRSVAFRERGDTFWQDQGDYSFRSDDLVELTYDPSVSVNLRITNSGIRSIDVFVDLVDYGRVSVGQTRDFLIPVGRRELYVRELGDSTASSLGTYNFNQTTIVSVTYP